MYIITRPIEDGQQCRWERLKALTGTRDERRAGYGYGSGRVIVEIRDTDVGFISENCGLWAPLDRTALTPVSVFGDGTWFVGTEVQAGLYSAPGSPACFWERLGGLTGTGGDGLYYGAGDYRVIAEILDTDVAFISSECGDWTPFDFAALSPVSIFGDGTWIVGTEVKPGLYSAAVRKVEDSERCYWERLDGFTSYDDQVGSGYVSHLNVGSGDYRVIVEILDTDVGFYSEYCGDWMPLDPAALSPLSVFGDGMRIIGTEVQPGLYSVSGGGDCEWGRLGAFTGNYDDKLGSGFSYGRTIVEILDTDMGFVSNECGEWTPLDISALSPVSIVGAGTWVVDAEIRPGLYSAPGRDFCYWERLSSFQGSQDDVIEYGSPDEVAIVEIEATDVGFRTENCGEWTRMGMEADTETDGETTPHEANLDTITSACEALVGQDYDVLRVSEYKDDNNDGMSTSTLQVSGEDFYDTRTITNNFRGQGTRTTQSEGIVGGGVNYARNPYGEWYSPNFNTGSGVWNIADPCYTVIESGDINKIGEETINSVPTTRYSSVMDTFPPGFSDYLNFELIEADYWIADSGQLVRARHYREYYVKDDHYSGDGEPQFSWRRSTYDISGIGEPNVIEDPAVQLSPDGRIELSGSQTHPWNTTRTVTLGDGTYSIEVTVTDNLDCSSDPCWPAALYVEMLSAKGIGRSFTVTNRVESDWTGSFAFTVGEEFVGDLVAGNQVVRIDATGSWMITIIKQE